jgi:ATP synthase protein I
MKNQSSSKGSVQTVSLGSQAMRICIELVSGVIVGASIGYILDEVFDFRFIFLLTFTILGGAAGIINVIRYVGNIKEQKEGN